VSGYFPLQYLPAENLNYYLNGATQAIQEWVNLITLAGLTPGPTQQGWTAISGLVSAFTLNKFAVTTSAQLASVISDETGSGPLVFSNSPVLVTPTLGAALATSLNGLSISTTVSGVLTVGSGNVLESSAIIRSLSFKGALTYATATTFSLAPGGVGDDTFVSTMILSSTLTKSLSAWAVGNNNGSLDTGAIAASTGYYVYLIKRPDTGVVDILISLSATSPTLPSNYTLKRMIGWVLTNGSSQLVQWIGYAGGEQAWQTLTTDVNDSTLTTARKTYTVANLPNVAHDTKFNMLVFSVTGAIVYYQGDSNLNDAVPTGSGPVTGSSSSISAGGTNIFQACAFYMTGRSLYMRSSVASTTITASIVSFNLRPYN
jgi:hypothetical protein